MKTTATLVAAALAATAIVAAPAAADSYPIGTQTITCTSDLSRLLPTDNKHLQLTARLAIGGIKPDGQIQHFTYAQYADIKVGHAAPFTRYPLTVTDYIKNTDRCVIAKLASPLITWHGENRATVRLYSSAGEWAETDIYRHLRSKCEDCSR